MHARTHLEFLAHISQVLVVKRVRHRYPLVGVEKEHLVQQINARGVLVREQTVERHTGVLHSPDGLLGGWVLEEIHVLLAGLAYKLDGASQLVHVVASRQQRLAQQQLGVHECRAPHVNLGVVVRVVAQQLRGAVPPRHHVLCLVGVYFATRET